METILQGFRVLAVDDDPLNLELLSIFFRQSGAEVETACSGSEALKCLQRAKFDLVILDLEMPGCDGYETASTIRREVGEIPMIALTGHVDVAAHGACREVGFVEVVSKPVRDWQLLVKRVEALLAAGSDEAAARSVNMELIRGASERLRAIFERAADDLPDKIAELDETWRHGDAPTAKSLSHRLRGTMANCGFVDVARLAASAEDELGKDHVNKEKMDRLLGDLARSALTTRAVYRKISRRSELP